MKRLLLSLLLLIAATAGLRAQDANPWAGDVFSLTSSAPIEEAEGETLLSDWDDDGYYSDFEDEAEVPEVELSTSDRITYILLALLPAVLLLLFILWRDRLRPEPKKELLIAFLAGLLTVPIAYYLEVYVAEKGIVPSLYESWRDVFRLAFVGAAIPEELAKILILSILFFWRKQKDEYMDGIVYAVCIGLAFAAAENLGYLFSMAPYGSEAVWATGVSRAFISVPGHFGFAVMMGFFYSFFLFTKGKMRFAWLSLAFVVPVVFHGLFDFFLYMWDVNPMWQIMMAFGFFAVFFLMNNLCVKAIRATLRRDQPEA